MDERREIWTIGHWTLEIPDFLAPLDEHDIDVLVDVRAHPGSRRSPQFGSDTMAGWLAEDSIEYRRLPNLGGRRPRQDVDSQLNAAWQNASFKNYADYTLTGDYRRGIEELTALARSRRTVVMCGEPVPWRCHRLIVANTLVAEAWMVKHLLPEGAVHEHVLGQWGAPPVVGNDGLVTYPDQSPG